MKQQLKHMACLGRISNIKKYKYFRGQKKNKRKEERRKKEQRRNVKKKVGNGV